MNELVVDKFEKLTNYDVTSYLSRFVAFVQEDQSKIYNYYAGISSKPDEEAFRELGYLLGEYNKLTGIISLNKNKFTTYDYWDLVENIDNSGIKLGTVNNYAKWLRSAFSLGSFNRNIELSYVSKQNQTIERISFEAGNGDANDKWVDLALKNKISEDSYDLDGGLTFKFYYQNDNRFVLNTVVDNIEGDRVYGIDFDKKITFEDNDLKILTPSETIDQSFGVLLGLTKGSVPEFPNDGLDKTLIGGNKNGILYPSILRQLFELFSKDDTFKSLSIIDIQTVDDSVQITVQALSRLDETLQGNL